MSKFEPVFFGFVDAAGSIVVDEFCVSTSRNIMQDEVDVRNRNEPGENYRTVALFTEDDVEELQLRNSELEARNASLQKIMDLAKDAVLGGSAAWSWTGYPNRKQLTRVEPESWKSPRDKSPLFSQEQVQGIIALNNDLHARNSELEAQLAEAKNKLADAEARQVGRTWP